MEARLDVEVDKTDHSKRENVVNRLSLVSVTLASTELMSVCSRKRWRIRSKGNHKDKKGVALVYKGPGSSPRTPSGKVA